MIDDREENEAISTNALRNLARFLGHTSLRIAGRCSSARWC